MACKETYIIKKYILYVKLEGELDQLHVERMEKSIFDVIDKYMIKYLVFNFDMLRFLDCSGIGLIFRCHLKNLKVVLCEMNDYIKKIVLLSGVHKFCIIKDNCDEVINHLEMLKTC